MAQPGTLTTPQDFAAFGHDLQDLLNRTHHENDAWAEGNTDTAFLFNNWVAIQRSHAPNDWMDFGIKAQNDGYGTYNVVDTSTRGGIKVDVLHVSDPIIQNVVVGRQDNRNNLDTPTFVEIKQKVGGSTTVTVETTKTSFLAVNAGFEVEGLSFGVQAGQSTENKNGMQKTENNEIEHTFSATVPPGKYLAYVITSKTITTTYNVRVPVKIQGYYLKCVNTDNKGAWNWSAPWDTVFGDAPLTDTYTYKATSVRIERSVVSYDSPEKLPKQLSLVHAPVKPVAPLLLMSFPKTGPSAAPKAQAKAWAAFHAVGPKKLKTPEEQVDEAQAAPPAA